MNVNTFAILLIILLAGCNFKNENTPQSQKTVPKEKSDTIVGIEVVPAVITGTDYIEKEYFVAIKNDTSGFSGIITQNKATGKVSINCRLDPYRRPSHSFSSDDTAAVDYDVPLKKPAKKLKYEDQLRQIELILSYASKDFDLSKSHSLRIGMSVIDEFSQNITQQYLSKYGERFPYGSNKNAVELVKSSRLTADLKKALAPYSLIIDKISIDGLGYTRAQDTADNARLEGMICWSVKKR